MASSYSLTICIIINSMIPVPYILLYSYEVHFDVDWYIIFGVETSRFRLAEVVKLGMVHMQGD